MLIVRRRQGLSRRNALLTAITAPIGTLHAPLHALFHTPSVRTVIHAAKHRAVEQHAIHAAEHTELWNNMRDSRSGTHKLWIKTC
jgi:hypothetical protein